MKFSISIHPINKDLMETLGIYDNSTLKNNRTYARIIELLYKAGYVEINHSSFVQLGNSDEIGVHTHLTMKKDENGRYYVRDENGVCHKV